MFALHDKVTCCYMFMQLFKSSQSFIQIFPSKVTVQRLYTQSFLNSDHIHHGIRWTLAGEQPGNYPGASSIEKIQLTYYHLSCEHSH